MSRYGPQVLPIAGPTLADALVQGVGSYMTQRDRMRREGFQDSAEVRATNADARAESLLGMQQAEEGRNVETYTYDRTTTRPLRQAQAAVNAYDDGVVRNPDGAMPAGNMAVDGAPQYSVDPTQTRSAQAVRAQAAQAQIAADNRTANALLMGQKFQNNLDVVDRKGGYAMRTKAMGVNALKEVARLRASAGGGIGAEALKQSEDKAGRSAMAYSRAMRDFEESGSDEKLRPALNAARATSEFDEQVYDLLLRERAPIALPTRGGPAPAPAPAGGLERAMTPGMASMPGNDMPQGVRGGAIPATPPPPPTTRKTREEIVRQRGAALRAGRDSTAVEARYKESLSANGYR